MVRGAAIDRLGVGLVLAAISCTADPAGRTAPPAPRCPAVPMRLMLEVEGGPPAPAVSLDATGGFRTALTGADPVAQLDPRGCMVGEDGVWVELAPDGSLWTLRERTPTERGRAAFTGRPLAIETDGSVRADDGKVIARLDGYRPEGLCVGLLLVQAFRAMMPSMAIVDGRPVELPPPEPSACPDRHRRGAGLPGDPSRSGRRIPPAVRSGRSPRGGRGTPGGRRPRPHRGRGGPRWA
jgi:hypothetical protein